MDTSGIVVIDDDTNLIKALSLFFRIQKKSANLTAFSSAEEALSSLRKNRYRIIICDYWLPGMNGIDFFRLIDSFQPDAKKILLISSRNDMIPQWAGEGGICGVISKPFTHRELEKLICDSPAAESMF